MTKSDDMFLLGKTLKPHGLKGDVGVKLDVDQPRNYEGLDMVWVRRQGTLVPYALNMVSVRPKMTVFHFDGVEDVASAAAMSGHELLLPSSALPDLDGLKFYYHEVVGFELTDVHHGSLGEIVTVLDLPNNPLFKSVKDGVEGLFPMTDAVLRKVDRTTKRIVLELPEGLFDLYFGKSEL
jgi:16S rRNA processing protein RimM